MIEDELHLLEIRERNLATAFETMSTAREESAAATRQLRSDLASAGYTVCSLNDLKSLPGGYLDAVPILLAALTASKDESQKESIVLVLDVKQERKRIVPALIAEFKKLPEAEYHALKWQIGSTIERIADDHGYDPIISALLDTSHGTSRKMLALALGRMKKRAPEAIKVLTELLKNDDLVGHVLIALRKLNGKEARPYVERYLTTKQTWVRKEAEKAIARFDRPDPQAAKAQ